LKVLPDKTDFLTFSAVLMSDVQCYFKAWPAWVLYKYCLWKRARQLTKGQYIITDGVTAVQRSGEANISKIQAWQKN
jgi:hypothetical protein